MNQSKTLGYILIGIGAILLVFGVVWALGGSIQTQGGRIVAIGFVAIIAAVLIGLGLYTLNRGNIESGEDVVVKREQKLLGMIMTQGKVNIASAAVELGVTHDQTKQLIYDLIGKQLFSGYVDWNAGMLFSADASKIKSGVCPKCGGKLELAGKGLVKCPYCGSEVFAS